MNMDRKEYQTVILGSLLHDIGKFLQRGSFTELDNVKHPKRSGEFISAFKSLFTEITDTDLLQTLAERHHEHPSFRPELSVQDLPEGRSRILAHLVSLADNLSSSERGDKSVTYQDYKATPLSSVFARVSTDQKKGNTALRYHPVPFEDSESLKHAFPEDLSSFAPGEMTEIIKSFGKEFQGLSTTINKSSFDCVLTHLMGMLNKYTWCIPANTQEENPDVSLFDHLKTTAAIASSLYRYHIATDSLNEKAVKANGEKFCLLAGDLSGIQKYIFDIVNTGVGGVARRLRSRSLFVQLISDIASYKILKQVGLPLTNLIISSGGKFYILLPNLPEIKETIQLIQREIDQWMLTKLNGELAINLAMVSFGTEGFDSDLGLNSGFGQILNRLDHELQHRKLQPFYEALQCTSGWDEGVFLRPTGFEGEQPCEVCRKFPKKKGSDSCDGCGQDLKRGRDIPFTRYIAFYSEKQKDALSIFDHSVLLSKTATFPDQPYLVIKLNNGETDKLGQLPALPKYIANYIPRAESFDCETCPENATCKQKGDLPYNNDDPAKFNCIANSSGGRSMLGFLKADVDNLGKLFVFGLKRDGKQQYDTISRLTTFSRMLDLFFSGWVDKLTSVDYPHCYTVFSGGDDLFLVGPWDELLNLADQIRNDFTRFTGNPDMTVSAGVFVSKARFPISRAANKVNEDLEASKTSGRNSITILNNTLTWEDWQFVKDQWKKLSPGQNEKASSAFLYNLLKYADMWQDYAKNNNITGLRYQPLLAYNLARNTELKRSAPGMYSWAEELIKLGPQNTGQRRMLDNMKLIVTLLILRGNGGV